MKLVREKALLLIIDLQKKLIPSIFNKEEIISSTKILIETFHLLELPIFFSEQYPQGLGETVDDIEKTINKAKNLKKFIKTSFSCYDLGNFKRELELSKKKQIVIAGIESHICVLQTSFDLISEGFQVFLVNEAIGSRKLSDKNVSVQRMVSQGITLMNIEMIIFELLRSSNHDKFKELTKKFIK
ncbi:MAG: isochorismatase family protein [Alphaproteobacteria bacterium]|tara:strand:- start:173 stop:727 length:555 start_codon:yes stop_codon:yes gene_type:complete